MFHTGWRCRRRSGCLRWNRTGESLRWWFLFVYRKILLIFLYFQMTGVMWLLILLSWINQRKQKLNLKLRCFWRKLKYTIIDISSSYNPSNFARTCKGQFHQTMFYLNFCRPEHMGLAPVIHPVGSNPLHPWPPTVENPHRVDNVLGFQLWQSLPGNHTEVNLSRPHLCSWRRYLVSSPLWEFHPSMLITLPKMIPCSTGEERAMARRRQRPAAWVAISTQLNPVQLQVGLPRHLQAEPPTWHTRPSLEK